MKWSEFAILLGGLGENSPLARTVAVRLEDDPEILKRFTSAQRRIRDQWRSKRADGVSSKDAENAVQYFQNMFRKMCS